MRKIRKKQMQNGFTLVELILYIALVSIFISGAVLFAWDIIYGGVKSQTQRNVIQNLRLVSKRISYEIRNASGVVSLSSSDLCLSNTNATYNPTRIYLSGGKLRIGWGGGSCGATTNDEPLTSSNVTVPTLIFTDLSSGVDSININFSVTVDSTGDRQEYQKSETCTSSIELRSN